jgi:hypothetical protein
MTLGLGIKFSFGRRFVNAAGLVFTLPAPGMDTGSRITVSAVPAVTVLKRDLAVVDY